MNEIFSKKNLKRTVTFSFLIGKKKNLRKLGKVQEKIVSLPNLH